MIEAIERVGRRVLLMIARAQVTQVNDAGAVQLLQALFNSRETRDQIPRLAEYGFTSNPPIGADVAIANIGGDRSNGVVVATGHAQSRPTGLQASEVMLYSQNGLQVYLSAAGLVINAAGLPVVCNDATNFTVNFSGVFRVVAPGGVVFNAPTLTNTGDILDQSGSNGDTMAGMRSKFNAHQHQVPNVQGGSSTITTQTPTVTQ